jgi:hypothetical protein
MFRFLYRWRYRRAQNAGAYKLPPKHRGGGSGRIDLASYLSQSSVRGRSFDRFDLPRKRRKGLAIIIVLLLAILLAWIVLESIAALELFRG